MLWILLTHELSTTYIVLVEAKNSKWIRMTTTDTVGMEKHKTRAVLKMWNFLWSIRSCGLIFSTSFSQWQLSITEFEKQKLNEKKNMTRHYLFAIHEPCSKTISIYKEGSEMWIKYTLHIFTFIDNLRTYVARLIQFSFFY